MLIKLTNATKEHENKPLLLNPRHIISVFPKPVDDDKSVTIIFGILQTSWEVQETVDQVYEMIK